jgi:hypothetical protein
MPYYINQTPMNPLSRLLAALVAALVLVGAFFFGLVVLALIVGLGLVFWLGLRVRLWWLRRHLPPAEVPSDGKPGEGEVIDAEYTVVSKKRD